MYIAKKYETDMGVDLTYSVAIYIGYNGQLILPDTSLGSLLPSLLLPELQWFPRPCPIRGVTARHVSLTFSTGDTAKIAYPFRPGSANWFVFWDFWEQIQAPEIVEIQGIGESCSDQILRKLLGLT